MSVILALFAASAGQCSLPPGWDAVAARKTPYVIFGEVHGTRQAPEFVGNVVCALARRKERVLLALEIGAMEDADLQAAWRLPTERVAAALTGTVRDWDPERAGGPMSQATLDMLVRLHRLRSTGATIDVVAFNGARDAAQFEKFKSKPGQGGHEAAQAENIRDARDRGRYDRVIVLVGNTHARRRSIELDGNTVEPMAMQLAPPSQVTALTIGYSGGTAFTCELRDGFVPQKGQRFTKSDMECRSRPTRGVSDIAGPPRIILGDRPPIVTGGIYDGFFWVGQIDAASAIAKNMKDTKE